jgi:class 3 adenylate cyclase
MPDKISDILYQENQTVTEYLKQSRVFGHLPDEILSKLAPISEVRIYKNGEEILTEGEINNFVYFLIRGELEVFASGELILTLRRTGDIIGEMSVISERPCSATVKAKGYVNLFCLRSRDVGKYTDLDPQDLQNALYRVFSMILTEKLSLTTDKAKQFESTNRELEETKSQLESSYGVLKEAQEKLEDSYVRLERLTNEFRLFVPKQFLEMREESDTHTLKPGHRVEEDRLTVLFSDIRSFSTFSEDMSSEETFDFLNDYLRLMEPCITSHNGVIDKFIGDAIMAIFEKPEDAVSAALAMESAIDGFNQKRIERGQFPISSGIGINTGAVMLGLLGTPVRLDSTVLGDTVNVAARLEELTKSYGVRIIISEFTFHKLANLSKIRLIDKVQIRGRQQPIDIYEVYACDNEKLANKKESLQTEFELGFRHYIKGDFEKAKNYFGNCLAQAQRDLVARLFYSRCKYLAEKPPMGAWGGVFRNRALRKPMNDLPGKLFFDYSVREEDHIAVLISNLSHSGALILVGHENQLYVGERIVLGLTFPNNNPADYANVESFTATCNVKRGKPGPMFNKKPYWQYALEFYEMSWDTENALKLFLEDKKPRNY